MARPAGKASPLFHHAGQARRADALGDRRRAAARGRRVRPRALRHAGPALARHGVLGDGEVDAVLLDAPDRRAGDGEVLAGAPPGADDEVVGASLLDGADLLLVGAIDGPPTLDVGERAFGTGGASHRLLPLLRRPGASGRRAGWAHNRRHVTTPALLRGDRAQRLTGGDDGHGRGRRVGRISPGRARQCRVAAGRSGGPSWAIGSRARPAPPAGGGSRSDDWRCGDAPGRGALGGGDRRPGGRRDPVGLRPVVAPRRQPDRYHQPVRPDGEPGLASGSVGPQPMDPPAAPEPSHRAGRTYHFACAQSLPPTIPRPPPAAGRRVLPRKRETELRRVGGDPCHCRAVRPPVSYLPSCDSRRDKDSQAMVNRAYGLDRSSLETWQEFVTAAGTVSGSHKSSSVSVQSAVGLVPGRRGRRVGPLARDLRSLPAPGGTLRTTEPGAA